MAIRIKNFIINISDWIRKRFIRLLREFETQKKQKNVAVHDLRVEALLRVETWTANGKI